MIAKGILFGDTHSYDDLNLILSECTVPPAKPKTAYIDIPGADGSVDLTESHGVVKYSDRDCTFVFSMIPSESMTWEEKKTEVSNLLNGQVFRITLDKDEDFYYQGRCTVNDYLSDRNLKQITVTARVHPYKFKQTVTVKNFVLTDEWQEISIQNSRKTVCPEITCTNDNVKISFGKSAFNLSAGTHKILDIIFSEGRNILKVSGSGTVTFAFQEGEL